ncbi:NUDIX hydrolase [Candidatus Magnetoovum chiemensis]|nr:NUDIX hydrolase [Candidatus Magnetoovum chiemensis]
MTPNKDSNLEVDNPNKEHLRQPMPTVDIIIKYKGGIILIKRKNPPYGWAIPGGFVDYGESLETAALREAKEETSLDIKLIRQMHTYSDPDRDKRFHTITTVYIAEADGKACAGDDAADLDVFHIDNLPQNIAFDHKKILYDYFNNIY